MAYFHSHRNSNLGGQRVHYPVGFHQKKVGGGGGRKEGREVREKERERKKVRELVLQAWWCPLGAIFTLWGYLTLARNFGSCNNTNSSSHTDSSNNSYVSPHIHTGCICLALKTGTWTCFRLSAWLLRCKGELLRLELWIAAHIPFPTVWHCFQQWRKRMLKWDW